MPQDIGHFKSERQARAYKLAQEIRQDVADLARDVIALDNIPEDGRTQQGSILLTGHDVLSTSLRQPQHFYALPVGKASADMVCLVEKNLAGQLDFDPASGNLPRMDLHSSRDSSKGFEYELSQGSALSPHPKEIFTRKICHWPCDSSVLEQVLDRVRLAVLLGIEIAQRVGKPSQMAEPWESKAPNSR